MAHPGRQAVCRCPQCRQFFCRECVTEHAGQFICSVCLLRSSSADKKGQEGRRKLLNALLLPLVGFTAVAFAWFIFYFAGSLLVTLSAPTTAIGGR
jgi:hypothetical protein